MKRRAPRISAGIALVLLSLVSPAAALEEADRLWLVGERAFADSLYPASRRALERFVAQYPKDARVPDAVLLLGKARLQAGDAQAALEAFKRAQTLSLLADFPKKYPSSPLVADAQFWSGWIKSTSGTDPSGGVAELEAFVAAHPNHPRTATARRLIPQALARSSDKADQLKAYKALMEQSPPAAEALYSAAEVAGRLDRPRDREAAWKRLSTDFPDHPLTLKLALDFGSAAFKQKSWKSAATYATQATKSDDGAVRSEAWLLLGESELKQKRYAEAAKAFETVGTVSEVETGVRFRALASLGLAREEQQSWKAALSAYEAVAARSPDATLRDWARERAGAVKARLSNPAPGKSAPSGGTKSGTNGTKSAAKKDSRP